MSKRTDAAWARREARDLSAALKQRVRPKNSAAAVMRYVAKLAAAKACWRRNQRVFKLIGYDAGPRDSRRAHNLVSDDWYEYGYPLRELGWDRPRITAELKAVGAPIPPKSACYYCPAAKPWEIARLVKFYPPQGPRDRRDGA